MRLEFAETKNVKRFVTALRQVLTAPPGIERMMLVYGDPGLGKSETALWWVNRHGRGAALIRTKKLMSGRWLLEELVAELGEAPAFRTSDLFRQAVDLLLGTDRVVIFDEVDYLTRDAAVLETLRDIQDTTKNPMIFIGMDQADKKLRRYRHLWRRFSQVVKYEPLDREDVEMVLGQICEVRYDPGVIDNVMNHHQGKVTAANLYRWAQAIEGVARRRKLDLVTVGDLPGGQ